MHCDGTHTTFLSMTEDFAFVAIIVDLNISGRDNNSFSAAATIWLIHRSAENIIARKISGKLYFVHSAHVYVIFRVNHDTRHQSIGPAFIVEFF